MASGKQIARLEPAIANTDDPAASLQQIIQEALQAYELAVATRLKIERETAVGQAQYESFVDALQRDATSGMDSAAGREQGVAAIEAARLGTLARLAGEAEEAAAGLLDSAALAHLRGVSDTAAGIVQPHTVTDELAAYAFAAAQTAAVDLRSSVLRLARAHLDNQAFQAARSILVPLQSAATGPLRNEAAILLYSTYLQEAVAVSASGNWQQARTLIDSALGLFPDNLGDDPALTELFLRVAGQLVDNAMTAGRPAEAAQHLTSVRSRLGHDHPELHRWTRVDVLLGWASGSVTCLHEFGGHDRPIQDMKFTADGHRLVSVDGRDIKTWSTPSAGPGALINTISAPRAYKLTGDALHAVNTSGELLSAANGEKYRELAEAAPGNVIDFASTRDGLVAAWATSNRSMKVNLYGEQGYTPVGRDGYGPADLDTAELLKPFQAAEGILPRLAKAAIQAGRKQEQYANHSNNIYRPATVRLIDSVHIGYGQAGEQIRQILIERPPIFLSMTLSAAGEFVAWLNPYGKVVLADTETGIVRHSFQVKVSETMYDTIAVSSRNQLVAAAQSRWQDGTVTVWNVATGGQVCSYSLDGIVGAIAFSPDERLIAALSTNGKIALYDIQSQSRLPVIGKHEKLDSPCLAFSPDGTRLATSGDRTIKVWGVQ